MRNLNDFVLHKLYGLIYADNKMPEEAAKEYEKALEFKKDGHTSYLLSWHYWENREYEKAREYALLAIENGYDLAYDLYKKVMWGYFRNYGETKKVLEEGMNKNISIAFICRYYLEQESGGGYNVDFLLSALECDSGIKKGEIALRIAQHYHFLILNEDPFFYSEDKQKTKYYYDLAYQYGFYIKSNDNFLMFENFRIFDDYPIYEKLLENFDKESRFIFLFALMEKQWNEKKDNNPYSDNMIRLLLDQLVFQDKNLVAEMIRAYATRQPRLVLQNIYYNHGKAIESVPSLFSEQYDVFFEHFVAEIKKSEFDDSFAS